MRPQEEITLQGSTQLYVNSFYLPLNNFFFFLFILLHFIFGAADTLKNEGIRHYFLDQVFCLKLFVFIEVIMWPSFQHVKNHSECKNFYFIELNML